MNAGPRPVLLSGDTQPDCSQQGEEPLVNCFIFLTRVVGKARAQPSADKMACKWLASVHWAECSSVISVRCWSWPRSRPFLTLCTHGAWARCLTVRSVLTKVGAAACNLEKLQGDTIPRLSKTLNMPWTTTVQGVTWMPCRRLPCVK